MIAILGATPPASALLSALPQAANPCARLLHDSATRVGPSPSARCMRPRYAARVSRLRLLILSVTSISVEFMRILVELFRVPRKHRPVRVAASAGALSASRCRAQRPAPEQRVSLRRKSEAGFRRL